MALPTGSQVGGSLRGSFLEVRRALRSLRRRPAFSFVFVSILALGIAATTALFSLADTALFRALPFAGADRMVRIFLVPPSGTPHISPRGGVFALLREESRSFSALLAQRYTGLTLMTADGPERIVGVGVSAGWSRTLGVAPVLGRSFSASEGRAGAAAGVCVLSYGSWQRRFGADPDVVGRRLDLDTGEWTVIGVMPRGFAFPYGAELWFPMRVEDEAIGPWSLNLQALLAPGVSLGAARSELAGLTRRLHRVLPAETQGLSLLAVPTRDDLLRRAKERLRVLLAGVGLLLALVFFDLAGLLLARTVARRRELAIRVALGAGRAKRAAPVVAESLLLVAAGTACGVVVSVPLRRAVSSLVPAALRETGAHSGLDARGWLVALGLALVGAVVIGTLPLVGLGAGERRAWLGVRGDGGAARRSPTGRWLVVAQLALAVCLLTGSALLLGDFARRLTLDLGYPADDLLTMSLGLDRGESSPAPARRRLLAGLLERAAASPEVAAIGGTTMFPSAEANSGARLIFEDRVPAAGERPMANLRLVTPGFFSALGVPLLRGRDVSARDQAGSPPVAVVSRTLAERYWPGESPIGKRLGEISSDVGSRRLTVVGEVADVREFWDIEPTIYLPVFQYLDSPRVGQITLVVRPRKRPAAAVATLRRAVAALAPGRALFDVSSANEIYRESLTPRRTAARVAGLFAALGATIAALGVYALLSYAASARLHELAIRLALGARPGGLRRRILAEGLRLAALGLVFGGVAATALIGWLRATVVDLEIEPYLGLAAAVLLLLLVTFGASWWPARRAARTDPMITLRADAG